MIVRQEVQSDYKATEQLIEEAFKSTGFSDGDEHLLVQRLRHGKAFIPELSLVAEIDGQLVGHILFTKLSIIGSKKHETLALAPVSVLPEFQYKGIGGKLILAGLAKATELGYASVIVLGHPSYYPKFGFEKASKWDIICPFEVPDESFMALELKKDALKGKSGIVEYAEEFGLEEEDNDED